MVICLYLLETTEWLQCYTTLNLIPLCVVFIVTYTDNQLKHTHKKQLFQLHVASDIISTRHTVWLLQGALKNLKRETYKEGS